MGDQKCPSDSSYISDSSDSSDRPYRWDSSDSSDSSDKPYRSDSSDSLDKSDR